MGVQFELRSMVDKALGCPEKGIVNFNLLHSLLHQILNHLEDGKSEKEDNIRVDSPGKEKGLKNDEQDNGMVNSGYRQKVGESQAGTLDDHKPRLPSSHSKWDDVDTRLHSLESKFEALNSLPTDQSIVLNAQRNDQEQTDGNSQNALAIMWKFMTINRRVQATEEAVEKVMGILNNVLQEIAELKNVRSEIQKLQEGKKRTKEDSSNSESASLPENFEKISQLLNKFPSVDNLAFKKDLVQFVTWSALDQALNKKEVQKDPSERKVDGGERDITSNSDRPDTAPVSSGEIRESMENAPPKTAMSPKEFYKLTGQDVDLLVDESNGRKTIAENEGVNGSLSSKGEKNSLGEISVENTGNAEQKLSCESSQKSFQPSPQLITQLNRLGELPKQYDDVAVQVSTISELQSKLASEVHKVEVDILPQKVDKDDLQLPDNLLEQIEMLKQGLESLNTNQDLQMLETIKTTTMENKENLDNMKKELGLFSQHLKRIDQPRVRSPESNSPGYDQDVLNSVREKLTSVQQEQEKMVQKSKDDIARILENLDQKQRLIDNLFQYAERLQERKADRENVATEMDVKADKHALDGKVNQSTFDETFEMFDRGLQEALQKMEDYLNEEMALKDTLSRISHEMEGKIDGDSLQLMKDYFEKQIKDVQESRNQIVRETRVDPTEAAGVRRKLPIQYHCISCNRPVEVTVKDSEPALPGIESLPLRRLKYPFASYEVEQLRQRSMKTNYNVEDSPALRDLLSGRPCGGSHTVINSQLRRSTKWHQFNHTDAARDDVQFPKMTREVSVLDFLRGSDGHYYKGRTKQVLPALPKRTVHPSFDSHAADQNSLGKGKQSSPVEAPSEHRKVDLDFRQRTPSPTVRDKYMEDLSASYPEKSNHSKALKASLAQHYSSDDISVPSLTSLNNRESIKILQNRRKRTQDKDNRRQRCWDNHLINGKKDIQDKSEDFDHEPASPKSIKRTTPVGQEESLPIPCESTHRETEPREQLGQKVVTDELSRIPDASKN